MGKSKGFTLVEMIVAVLLLTIISVPMLTTFYFGAVALEKQVGMTQALAMSRETMGLIVDDLEKYASNATKININGDETQLVIKDDSKDAPYRVVYTYNNNTRVLVRDVDSLQQILLTDNQLSDRYYTDVQRNQYKIDISPPVQFTKDDVRNRILIYLRVKISNQAEAQESNYIYTILEGDKARKVLKFEKDGYIKTNDSEKFNLYQSSFSIESYFKVSDIAKNRSLINLFGSDGKSKVKVSVGNNKLTLSVGSDTSTPNKFKNISINLTNADTLNMWRKFVVVYEDNKKSISMYLTKSNTGKELNMTPTKLSFDCEGIFYGEVTGDDGTVVKPITVDEIYFGNESSDANITYSDSDYMYMYEPKVFTCAIDVSKYDITKRLVGNEEGLLVYLRDEYERRSDGSKVKSDIVNAVNNKPMIVKNAVADEEIETLDKIGDDIQELLGY